jgi:Glycosyltransferase family 87
LIKNVALKQLTSERRPPLWLAAAAVASGWAAIYSIGRWILLFALGPVHEDVRMTYVAAEAGLRYGWSTIYDPATLSALSKSFPANVSHIDSLYTYLNPPLLAWLFAPLTVFSEPLAYVLWTVLSLAALVLAWRIAAPYSGLAKITLLLLAIGLWPVLLAFYFGQPSMILLALVAAAWWFCAHDRPLAAGAALALATFLKPQDVILVPVALLVSGRYRSVAGWMAGCAVLSLASIATLGSSGLISWYEALKLGQANSAHTEYTLAYLFGFGPWTYALWGLQGAAALFVARRRKVEPEMVFTAGVLGSAAVAFHFHELDYSVLVLAGWLFLCTSPPLWHRLWLLVGVATMQVMTYGLAAPQLIWDASWLAILAAGSVAGRGVIATPSKPGVAAEARPGT